jgi:ubiquinone biosynthesis protein Coq4
VRILSYLSLSPFTTPSLFHSLPTDSSAKRNLVEKRIEFRLQTIDKFNDLHEESLARIYEQTLKQNEAARQRNHNLLRQIGAGHFSISVSQIISSQ